MSVRRVATASRGAKAGMFGRCAGVVGAVTFLVAACAGGSGGPDTAPAADRAGPSPTAPAATPGIDGGSYDVVDPAAEARGWFDVSQPERTEFRDLSAEFVARDDTEVTREYRAFVTRLGASAVAVRSALRRAGAPPQQAEALVAELEAALGEVSTAAEQFASCEDRDVCAGAIEAAVEGVTRAGGALQTLRGLAGYT